MKIIIDKLRRIATSYSIQILIFVFFATVYWVTRYPGVGGRVNAGDSAKWQYLHLADGLPHGTGYPQFLFLSEIFSRLIFFLDLPERITFISVFFGALSLSVFYSLMHLLTKDRAGSILSTLLVGFSYVFWAEATEAEVYTLNVFYLLTVFYLFIKFYLTKYSKYYLAGCTVYALSFGNHLSMITILPAVAFITVFSDYRTVFKPRNLLLVALFVLLGALQYAFIYYRAYNSDPYYTEIVPKPTIAQFLTYLTGGDKSTMLAFTFEEIIDTRVPVLLNFLKVNFTYVGILLAFAGFFYYLYVKKAYVILAFLSLAILGQIAFNISYNVSDLIVFFVPVYVLVGLFIGLVFSANQDIIPKTISLLLVIHLFSTNISSGNILLKNTYWLNHFKPLVALYHQQKDSLPLYYPLYGFDYYTHQYVNYLNLSGSLGEQKTLIDSLSIIRRLDSFYVESSFPNLADAYNFELVASESITSFVQQYSKPHNAIFFSIRGEGADNLSKEFISVLKAYGSNIESLSPGGSYAAVLYDGRMIESIDGAGVAVIKSDSTDNDPLKGELSYKVYSAGSRSGDSSAIEIKGYNYSVNRRGMNIVVYDKQNADVTDMVSFDIITKEEKRLFKAIKKEYYASKAPKPPIGKTIALKGFNDLYVGRENGGPTLVCNKETVDAWEKFEVVDAGGGKIALRSGGKFVSSENGNGPMNCSRSSIGDWEKFDWIVNSDSTVTLKGSSWFNASVENEKGSIMCNTSTIGNKEKFTLQIIP